MTSLVTDTSETEPSMVIEGSDPKDLVGDVNNYGTPNEVSNHTRIREFKSFKHRRVYLLHQKHSCLAIVG